MTPAVSQALAAGDYVGAATAAEESLPHVLAANGLDDDFMSLWPPIVLAALAAEDVSMAERLLEPVATAPAGVVSPGVNAQFHRLRGLLGAARGDDPGAVEADLRAGVTMVMPRSAVIYAPPLRETAFLVDATATRAPATRSEALLDVLAQLERRRRSQRTDLIGGNAKLG